LTNITGYDGFQRQQQARHRRSKLLIMQLQGKVTLLEAEFYLVGIKVAHLPFPF